MNSRSAGRFDIATRAYIALVAIAAFALWNDAAFEGPRTYRIVFTIAIFAVAGLIPAGRGNQRYVVGLLRLLSALALTALAVTLYAGAD